MAECIHRKFCVNDCPCDYYEESPFTGITVNYRGACITYAKCDNCGQMLQFFTDNSFNLCPYCGKRLKY